MNIQFIIGAVRITGYLLLVAVAAVIITFPILITYDKAASLVANLWEKRPWKK